MSNYASCLPIICKYNVVLETRVQKAKGLEYRQQKDGYQRFNYKYFEGYIRQTKSHMQQSQNVKDSKGRVVDGNAYPPMQ